jgi:hypothetical protein
MSDIELQIALMESGRMNLMHLPAGAISWLWDRPTKQIDAAESLAVAANAHGNPVVDASLLKADQNVLLIKCQGGETFRIYPDGGFSHNDTPMDIGGCSSVLQGMGQSECEMDDNGHQMDASVDMPMDMPMNMDMPMGMPMVMGESQEYDRSQDADAGYNYDHQGSGSQPFGEPDGDIEPDYETDGFILDEPRGGYGASLEQKFLGNFQSAEDAAKAIRQAAGPNYFPSLWFVDDHGGVDSFSEDVGDGSERDPDRAAERFRDGDYDDERSEPELDRQTNYDAPPWRDGDDSYDLDEAGGGRVLMPVAVNQLEVGKVYRLKDEIGQTFKGRITNVQRDGERYAVQYTYVDDSYHEEGRTDWFDVEANDLDSFFEVDNLPKGMRETGGNDEHMDAEAPESGVASPVGMTNLAGEPTMDEAEGAGGGVSMGSGSGAPYVGDMAMDADPEIANMMMSREIGEASIHMFRNESDNDLAALAEALGLGGYDPSDDQADVENIKLEVYDESTDSYQEFPVTVAWNVEPAEFDGQYQSYRGGADVERIDLVNPIRVNGKVYRQMNEELAALVLQTYNTNHTSLYDYVTDEYSGKIEVPQHKYPDSTR